MTNDISNAAAALGRKGGSTTGGAKAEASRANGALGGRPAAWERDMQRRSGYVILDQRYEHGEDGHAHMRTSTLWLEEDGGTRLEESDDVVVVPIGWQRKQRAGGGGGGKWQDVPESGWPAAPGSWLYDLDYAARHDIPGGVFIPREEWRPVNRPLTDDELREKIARQDKSHHGVLSQWPTETYGGTVRLAGSKDRWVTAIGLGGHTDNLPGTYASAGEAREALAGTIASRQERIRQIVAKRCAPHEVTCAFPATHIDVIGDESIVATSLGNRAERRKCLQWSKANG